MHGYRESTIWLLLFSVREVAKIPGPSWESVSTTPAPSPHPNSPSFGCPCSCNVIHPFLFSFLLLFFCHILGGKHRSRICSRGCRVSSHVKHERAIVPRLQSGTAESYRPARWTHVYPFGVAGANIRRSARCVETITDLAGKAESRWCCFLFSALKDEW